MLLVLADDSSQLAPSRAGIGAAMYGAGGILVGDQGAAEAERELHTLCLNYGFPPEEKFKWSPGRELWMRDNLKQEIRLDFFRRVIEILRSVECRAIVVILDSTYQCVSGADASERDLDAMRFLILRTIAWLREANQYGVMVMDQPGGAVSRQRGFVASCAQAAMPVDDVRRIVVAPVAAGSEFIRLLQAADVVISCTLAHVSGELRYSPPVFERIRDLLCLNEGRVGGTGLLVHPAHKYVNLYHWLLGDVSYRRGPLIAALPLSRRPYAQDEWSF